MKITYNWLKDYIDIKVTPEKLAHLLTMAGSEVTSIQKKGGDFIFELEITPNRPDCLSAIGIAREIAAITGKKLRLPASSIQHPASKKVISIEIIDKELCPRYSGRVIEGVKVKDSPGWMQERLKAVGLRPVNNIVDITNFCLLETGQPMHAFDYDKIKGSKVFIRCAKKDESITTIDGVKRPLSPDILIIADEERPIAIAGVMGGLDTEVNPSTKRLLLESAYFDPVSVRLTSRRLGLASESSYRFERSVDIEQAVAASNRAAFLINELTGGKAGVLVDKGSKRFKSKQILYDVKKTARFLGCNISSQDTKSIFKALGFEAKGTKNRLRVKVPSFRQDLSNEIGLVEEAARIYGYDKMPSTIPEMVSQPMRKDLSRVIQERIRANLVASGLTEIVTYSLISKNLLDKLPFKNIDIINIVNPLSAEQEILRPTILSGTLNTILWNINRKIESLMLFELGNVYFKDKGTFKERLNLTIALTGKLRGDWRQKKSMDFFDIKGIIEALFHRLGIKDFVFSKEKSPCLSPAQSAVLKVGGRKIGVVGKLKNEVLTQFDIEQDVYAAELEIDTLLPFIKIKSYFEPIPKFPSIKRDISIVLDKGVSSSEISSAIKGVGIPSIRKVEVFDEYYGKQIPQGKRGLSFSIIYQDKTKTLTDEEVDRAHSKVKEVLAEKFSAQFR